MGDGINDLFVFFVCDVGILFVGSVSYFVIVAVDIVFFDEKLFKIVDLIKDLRFIRKIVI